MNDEFTAHTIEKDQRYQALMLDYAAGSLPRGPALVVSAHLALQPQAREITRTFDAAGGMLLDTIEPVEIAQPAWLEAETGTDYSSHSLREIDDMAHVLSSIDQGRWRRNLAGMLTMPLPGCDAELLKLEAGRKVPEHGHSGLEVTLVLSGALDDGNQIYRRGELLVHDEDSEHQPGAAKGGDCICLIAQTGNVRLKGPLGWLINRFN
ncbi:ChrR family anti-sigma-E factor [Aquidulcibacter sp.]|uniref:ChrR family anti-sigma-E factor n=1 Tax=Aquidulcibacter sp. TaxID=2052990 RepID=UPI0025BAA250|nr:ChrR family anti-sigma-E factor [Aquidulcibacter sp.]MCA3692284.1 cupin domain-containing protein [Aquidulcibacter sp.]